ncbi:MAG: hypothetical protein GIKADHBN_03569 [Phycisphaerales bacterium]|nr:hypothetical protein [Phycisphaerales bacterium]
MAHARLPCGARLRVRSLSGASLRSSRARIFRGSICATPPKPIDVWVEELWQTRSREREYVNLSSIKQTSLFIREDRTV